MITVIGIEILFLTIIGLLPSYLLFLSIAAIFQRKRISFETSGVRRFAIVIPAHDEEESLSVAIDSVFAMDYPRRYFDLIILADNCSDHTADVARDRGAMVHERNDPTLRGKGYALRWGFDRLLASGEAYDGFIVLDADSVISKNFLRVMNYYLEHGSRALQSNDQVQRQAGAWSSEMTRLSFVLYNYVRPLGRKALSCSAGLRGNGMCFSREALERVPWNSFSLNEDLEQGLELLLQGIRVDFAPEAGVLATMPANPVNAESQRERWEKGRSPVIRAYASRLLRAGFRMHSFRPLDALIDLLTPPLVKLLAVIAVVAGIHAALGFAGVHEAQRFLLPWVLLFALGILHVIIGMFVADADASLYRTLGYIPRYVIWKVGLYVRLALRGSATEWVRTTRERPSIGRSTPENSENLRSR